MANIRNRNNDSPLGTLRVAVDDISEPYKELRDHTLLDFGSIPNEILETFWHEFGRLKEKNGERNKYDIYSITVVCKPLLLVWGQTLAFDSVVREHISENYDIPKNSGNWQFNDWAKVMKEISRDLNDDEVAVKFIRKETEKKYGKGSIVPYGRFLDIYYWEGP